MLSWSCIISVLGNDVVKNVISEVDTIKYQQFHIIQSYGLISSSYSRIWMSTYKEHSSSSATKILSVLYKIRLYIGSSKQNFISP